MGQHELLAQVSSFFDEKFRTLPPGSAWKGGGQIRALRKASRPTSPTARTMLPCSFVYIFPEAEFHNCNSCVCCAGITRLPVLEGEISHIEIPRVTTNLGITIVGGADTALVSSTSISLPLAHAKVKQRGAVMCIAGLRLGL